MRALYLRMPAIATIVLVVGAGGLGCPIVDYLTMQKKKLTGIYAY